MSSSKAKPFSWMEEVQRKAYEVKQLENSPEGRDYMASDTASILFLCVNANNRAIGQSVQSLVR
jgi:hypothetical protein